jgi:hypothetical protein
MAMYGSIVTREAQAKILVTLSSRFNCYLIVVFVPTC